MAKVLKLLRFKRSNMFKNVGSIIEDKCNPDSTVIDIRDILRFYSSTFRKQLAQCQSIHDTLELISDNSSLTDICMLESLVGKLNIDEAKEVVRDYNEAVEELNKKDLTQSLEEILSNISPLQCETITILVDKKDAELILDDVTIYLRNLFLKLSPHIRVYANDIDNSVNITCSFPLILSEQLITAALNNIDVLKENKVKRLTIGYCTVYEVNDTSTDTTTDLDEHQFSILISTRSGLLKQLMLSLSVQLNNSKEEVDALNEEIMTMKKEAESLKEEAESLKEETKSFKETLDTKNKILRVSIAESERFKKMAAETSQLLQEKVSQLTEREEENEKLKEMREVLEEQLALFQAEKEGEHNERIEQHAEVSHQHVNEVKSNEEIELLQEKISRMSLQLIEKDNQLQEKEYQLKLTMDKLRRITEQLQNSLKQAESRENTLQEKISQMSQENEAKIQEMEEKLFQKGSQIEILKGRLSSSHFERQENLEFKDAIYGFIKIEHPLLIKIVKTEQFARLKSIGCIYHDKSKAHYSRYDYCIGMYYFAGKFVKTLRKRQPVLNITDSDVLCVEIAALCYNLGHGPFSHTFADFLKEIKASRRYWKGLRANVMMFQHMIEVNRLPFNEYFDNPEQDIEFIKELMTGKQGPQATLRKDKVFLYEIVVNKMSGLDVNRMDYTMRDAVVLGKRINFKWRKFLNKIRVEVCPDGKKHICANEEDLGTYNELFADRHALFKELYFERKNRTVATMINRILLKCGEAEFIKGPDGKWLSLIDAIKTMDTYCCLNEEILEVINETIADPEVEKLIKFLSNSKLLIPIGYVKNCQLAGGIQQLKEEIIENEDGLSQDDIIVDV